MTATSKSVQGSFWAPPSTFERAQIQVVPNVLLEVRRRLGEDPFDDETESEHETNMNGH